VFDGHQHVHQFPIIRTVLLKLYEQYLRPHPVSIRSTYPMIARSPYPFKSTVLSHTGGKKLRKALLRQNIAHNKCFGGIYDFSSQANYRALFQQWLHRAPNDTLLMCHPGEGLSENDPIAPARQLEMAYFSSEEFVADCIHYQILI
jgi:chitin disaccharide deacetylase